MFPNSFLWTFYLLTLFKRELLGIILSPFLLPQEMSKASLELFILSSISAYWKLHNLQVCFDCLWHVRFWVSPGVQRWEVFLSISFPIYKVRMTVPTSSIVLRTKWGSICKTHLDKPTADGGCYCNEDIITALKVLLILKGKTHKLVIDSTCHC